MINSGLVLFPLLAFVLVFRCTWVGGGAGLKLKSRDHQRKIRAKVILHRCLISSLFLATLIVQTRPIELLPDLVFGTLIVGILIVPVFAHLLVCEIKARLQASSGRSDTSYKAAAPSAFFARSRTILNDAGLDNVVQTREYNELSAASLMPQSELPSDSQTAIATTGTKETPTKKQHVDFDLG